MGRHRRTALFTISHTAIDFYATLFPPLLRLFRDHFGLTLTQVSSLPASVAFFGSVVQPLFGILSERFNRPRVAGISVLVAAVCMSSIGFARSPVQLLPLLICGALGVAVFHPTSGAAVIGGRSQGANVIMSLFMMGGSLGLAISPTVSTGLVQDDKDMQRLGFLMIPGIVLGFLLLIQSSYEPLEAGKQQSRSAGMRVFFEEGAGALWTLWGIAFFRSVVFYVLQNFLSVYGETRNWTNAQSGRALSLFLICGTVGGIVGGTMADRLGPRRLMVVSTFFWCFFIQVFLTTSGVWSLIALGAAGFFSWLGAPINVVLAQRMKPNAAATVTGMMMGLAWGIAGLTLPAFAALAESYGDVGIAIRVAACGLLIACGLVFVLPSSAQMMEMGQREIASGLAVEPPGVYPVTASPSEH